MKNLYRYFVTLLAITILLTSFCVCYAENSKNRYFNDTVDYYKEYLSSDDILSAKKEIVINAESFLENNTTLDADILKNETVSNFTSEEDALYSVEVTYETYETESADDKIEISMKVDGEYPYSSFENIALNRYFKDDGEVRKDNLGNEIYPLQKENSGVYTQLLYEQNNTYELVLYLVKGEHTLSLKTKSDDFAIISLALIPCTDLKNYDEYFSSFDSSVKSDEYKIIEAENAELKSKSDLVSYSDNSSANVYPADPNKDKINYIGGVNWSTPGSTITWKFNVEKSGFYKIGLNYRQNKKLNATFYRRLLIDGKVPFTEANSIEFPYARSWKFMTVGNDEEPYGIYLESGEHTLSFSVTLGDFSEVYDDLQDVSYELAALYRKIVVITGDTPDANRDYALFTQISDLENSLKSLNSKLDSIKNKLNIISDGVTSTYVSTIDSLIITINKMLDNKYSAHKYLTDFYNYYASVSSTAEDISNMPLDLDRIYITGIDNDFENTRVGFFSNLTFSIKRFLKSFAQEYSSNSVDKNDEKLTVWVNWGRDQTKVLKYLIQSDFCVKTGINVDIKITNASLLHASLSGDGPDVQLYLSRSEPVNLAMRTALYDLSQFDDFDEVCKRFMPGATVPYEFQGGVYALPDSQTFFVMFIRDDIFEELGLKVPKTWDEFLDVSSVLIRNNMNVGMPYTQIVEMTQVNTGVGSLSIFPTFLIQRGGELYKDNYSKTNLLTQEAISSFEYWTNLYSKYSFPKTYDFFNRFRIGMMPMAIQNYNMYATLSAAAPEIEDYWSMYCVPGTYKEDGSIDYSVTDGGTGCAILSQSENKDAAWRFLKWWTSKDVQYQYGSEVENILGTSARVATSNIEALKKYKWADEDLDVLLKQWGNVESLKEVPGSYYVSRVIDQAFWNSVSAGENTKDMLLKWSKIADTEIERRREQYGIK